MAQRDGQARIDKAAITAEAHLDGKFLLRSDDESLSAEDIALGYKSLYEAERGWRDLKKTTLNICPVYHRREDRIRAHVQLCWLALLVLRVAEIAVGATLTNDSLSNALVESTNTKLRLLTRVAYEFRSTDNLISRCLLDRGGYCPPLPSRTQAA